MKNWKTTLLGLLAGFLQLYSGGMTAKAAAAGAALAALGIVAKDGGA